MASSVVRGPHGLNSRRVPDRESHEKQALGGGGSPAARSCCFPLEQGCATIGQVSAGGASGGDVVATATLRRRLLQPLWNALDDVVGPRGALLAVSGGPDSRALLEAVARWPRRHEEIRVASVDHGTRPEAPLEARAVVERARVLGFEAAVLVAAARGTDEAALRAARRAVLVEHARAAQVPLVVTAHHAGDVAEGAALSWLGTGGTGAAMPGQGAWDDVEVARPFVGLPREALRLALAACGVDDAFADPDARSSRARLRRERLAPLGAARADVEERLAEAARRRRDDEEALAAAADLLLDLAETDPAGSGTVRIRPGAAALVRRAVRRALALLCPGDDVRSSSPAVDIVVDMLARGASGTVHLRGATAEVAPEGVALRRIPRSP
jgi:tRNA(Ile)-lysidine synthase